jgi:trk system potassium uptake protein TrkA
MKIVILGAGQIGLNLARYFVEEGHDITLVDHNSDHLRRMTNTLDIQPVCGHASHPQTLKDAGAHVADILIAVTGSDEVNMVSCEVAHSLFQVETKIARVRSEAYLDPYWSELFSPRHLAIDIVITPEAEIANSIARSISVSGAFDVVPAIHHQAQIVGVKAQSFGIILNTPLTHISTTLSGVPCNIISIQRGEDNFIPSPHDTIEPGDEVYLSCLQKDIPFILSSFGHQPILNRRVLILGAGNVGTFLAKRIHELLPSIEIKIIEKHPRQAERVASQLPHVDVVCGDALDQMILKEAGVSFSETCISVTNDDKSNILATLLSKQLGVQRGIVLMNDMSYAGLVGSLGIDNIVSPKAVTISNILRHIRSGQLHSLYSIKTGFAEIIEADIQPTSSMVGMTVSTIELAQILKVACILRNDEAYIDTSSMGIAAGDRLIILVRHDAIEKIEKLFSSRLFIH